EEGVFSVFETGGWRVLPSPRIFRRSFGLPPHQNNGSPFLLPPPPLPRPPQLPLPPPLRRSFGPISRAFTSAISERSTRITTAARSRKGTTTRISQRSASRPSST